MSNLQNEQIFNCELIIQKSFGENNFEFIIRTIIGLTYDRHKYNFRYFVFYKYNILNSYYFDRETMIIVSKCNKKLRILVRIMLIQTKTIKLSEINLWLKMNLNL